MTQRNGALPQSVHRAFVRRRTLVTRGPTVDTVEAARGATTTG
ncbi:hypothetical protein ABT001_20095 [Streptomyces sp. NPDC002793]